MAITSFDTELGDGVMVSTPGGAGRLVLLPEKGDGTNWHKYPAGETYKVTAHTRLVFRREVRREDGSIEVEQYDLQPGSTIIRTGPFEHRVISECDKPILFCKRPLKVSNVTGVDSDETAIRPHIVSSNPYLPKTAAQS